MQTVQIQMRLLIMSRLICLYIVCKFNYFFFYALCDDNWFKHIYFDFYNIYIYKKRYYNMQIFRIVIIITIL